MSTNTPLSVPGALPLLKACTLPLDHTRFGRSHTARLRSGQEAFRVVKRHVSYQFGSRARARDGVEDWSNGPLRGQCQTLLNVSAESARFTFVATVETVFGRRDRDFDGPLLAFLADIAVPPGSPAGSDDLKAPTTWAHLQVRALGLVDAELTGPLYDLASDGLSGVFLDLLQHLEIVVDGHPHPVWEAANPAELGARFQALREGPVSVPVLVSPVEDVETFVADTGGAVTVIPLAAERDAFRGQGAVLLVPALDQAPSKVLSASMSDFAQRGLPATPRVIGSRGQKYLSALAVATWHRHLARHPAVPPEWIIPASELGMGGELATDLPTIEDLENAATRLVGNTEEPELTPLDAPAADEVRVDAALWERLAQLVDADPDLDATTVINLVASRLETMSEQLAAAIARRDVAETKALAAARRADGHKTAATALRRELDHERSQPSAPSGALGAMVVPLVKGTDEGHEYEYLGEARCTHVPVRSVEAAARVAAQICEHLVITPSALASAANSIFPRPERVLADLLALDEVSRRWRGNQLRDWYSEITSRLGEVFRAGISQTARTMYGEDYHLIFDGHTYLMSPHIARGIDQRSAIRIYWALDTEHKRLLVGHIGAKLRDRSNH